MSAFLSLQAVNATIPILIALLWLAVFGYRQHDHVLFPLTHTHTKKHIPHSIFYSPYTISTLHFYLLLLCFSLFVAQILYFCFICFMGGGRMFQRSSPVGILSHLLIWKPSSQYLVLPMFYVYVKFCFVSKRSNVVYTSVTPTRYRLFFFFFFCLLKQGVHCVYTHIHRVCGASIMRRFMSLP